MGISSRSQGDADVLVVGGGAAGTSAAINLARLGRQVILLESRPVRPPQLSDLHSGEVLSPGSQQELARLGLDTGPTPEPGAAGDFLNCWKLQGWDSMRQHWPGGGTTWDKLPSGLAYWQINRGHFYRSLQDLAQASGVQVRTGWRVIDTLRTADGSFQGVLARPTQPRPGEVGAEPEYLRLRAPVVIDAGGRNSVILARLGLKQAEPEFGRAAYIFFFSELGPKAVEAGVWQQFWLPNATTLRGSQLAPQLYRYSFEMSLAQRERWQRRWGRLAPHELFLQVLAEELPQWAAHFRDGTRLPHMLAFAPIGFRVRTITHDGLLMVGDAAGYLDPSTGQGLEFALRMGRLAAHSVALAFERNSFERRAFDRYLAGREAEVQPLVRNLRRFLRVTRQSWVLDSVGKVGPVRRAVVRNLVSPRPAQAE